MARSKLFCGIAKRTQYCVIRDAYSLLFILAKFDFRYHRSESCATNYSYHLDTNDESKRKNLLASLFMKKAKSLDDLLSMKTSKQEKVGKSTFYNDTEEGMRCCFRFLSCDKPPKPSKSNHRNLLICKQS